MEGSVSHQRLPFTARSANGQWKMGPTALQISQNRQRCNNAFQSGAENARAISKATATRTRAEAGVKEAGKERGTSG